MIMYGSLEWAVDLLKTCVEAKTGIEKSSKKVQEAAKKIGMTAYYSHQIDVLTEEICQGCYHSQNSEEYRRIHPEYFQEQPTTEEIMQMMYDEIPDEEE